MFKKIIFSIFCWLLICQPAKTQLVFNQYSTLLLDTAGYGSQGLCLPLIDVFLGLDSNLDTVATGMETVAILTAVTGSVNVGGMPAVVGDTIRFDTSNAIPVSFAGLGWLSYEWWAIGTPTVLNEPYHCKGFAQSTVAGCMNFATVIPSNPNKDCSVSLANEVDEGRRPIWSVVPNPAVDQVKILNQNGVAPERVRLLNLKGEQVRSWKEPGLLLVGDLPRGLYLLEIKIQDRIGYQKLLLPE